MVDPNRKINLPSESEISFLQLCEEKFKNRYTEDDPQFMEHCQKPVPEPPVLPPVEPRFNNNRGRYNRHNRFHGSNQKPYKNHRYREPYGQGNSYRGRGGGEGGRESGGYEYNYKY